MRSDRAPEGSASVSAPPTLAGGGDAAARPSGPPRPSADRAFASVGRTKPPALEPELANVAATAKLESEAGNHKAARAAADRVLGKHPEHPTMLRVAAEAACAMGDGTGAQSYYNRASPGMRVTISIACKANNVVLAPAPPRSMVPQPPKRPATGSGSKPKTP